MEPHSQSLTFPLPRTPLPRAQGSLSLAGLSRSLQSPRSLLVLGRNQRTLRVLRSLEGPGTRPVRVVGLLDAPPTAHSTLRGEEMPLEPFGVDGVGRLEDLREFLRHTPVDEVLITLPLRSCYGEIESALRTCEEAGVPVSLHADLFDVRLARPVAKGTATPGTIAYTTVPHSRAAMAAKRAMDIAGSLALLLVLGIPMLAIALLVKLTSRGPVLFRQKRSGLHHRPFHMLKFRTMVKDAEARKDSLKHLNEQTGPVFKIRRDPRITPLGRFLRRFSLDELPQLLNVLRGEMSLVGPRPPIVDEVKDYQWSQRRRLSMKPGLTCLWQVRGRNRIGFEDWVRLDLEYIDRWSLLLDLKVLLATIPAVFRGSGS